MPNQYSEYSKRNKYIFLLVIFLVLIIILASVNPLGLFSKYLFITLPIIIFFLSFVIAILLLYNRDTTDTSQTNIETSNWIIKSFIILVQFVIFAAFIYWVIVSANPIGSTFNFNILILFLIFSVNMFALVSNFFSKNPVFPGMSVAILTVIFILFFMVFIILKTTTSNSMGDKYPGAPIILFYCAICIGFLLLFYNSNDFVIKTANEQIMVNYFVKALLFLFGSGISALFIYWIVTSVGKLDSNTSIISLILNILIVTTILGLAYKAIVAGKIFKSSPFVSLIVNILLYIPCIFVNIVELLVRPLGGIGSFSLPSFSLSEEYKNTTRGSIVMLILVIVLFIIYFSLPYIRNTNVLQGGKQLLNEPVYSNSEQTLGAYGDLNGSDDFNYKYGLSFWFYIDSSAPSSNASYSKYTSLLSYGNKPSIKYNASTNTLIVLQDLTGGPPTTCPNVRTSEDAGDDSDETGLRIVYRKKDVLLQKWNNIIINYTGGTLDIFYNGELVKSSIDVIPYMKLDTLTIGAKNGLHGGICNVIYFKKPLDATQIYYIYNSVKHKTPPTLYTSNFSILQTEFAASTAGMNSTLKEGGKDINMQLDAVKKDVKN